MTEDHAPYETETADAVEMLGIGYEYPSIEIIPATTTMQRRGREFIETETPAFVKISTAFKLEMADVDEVSLKVWLYIALSVNRHSGKANPGVRTIAKDCGLDKDTVSRAVKRLEGYGLLTVDRESRKYNIYQPTDYVSANKSVPSMGTVAQSVPIEAESVPIEAESVPTRGGLNQKNQNNHILSGAEIQKIQKAADKKVDAILANERKAPGRSWSSLPEIYHPYGKAFCDATGLSYHKKYLIRWIEAFDEWQQDGYQPADIARAVDACRGRTDISAPGSITWKLRAMIAERPAAKIEIDPYASLRTYLEAGA